jgi:hypothetical protein
MNLPYRRGWRTNGWAAGAASAFASCRHVAAHALGSNGPRTTHAPQQTAPWFDLQMSRGKLSMNADDDYENFTVAFLLASGFATSRAQSIKSCATGVRVRFFKVTIPANPWNFAMSMGKTLIAVCPPANSIAILSAIVRNRPLATRATRATSVKVTTVVRGTSSPAARKSSAAIRPGRLSGAGSVHGSFIRSASATLRGTRDSRLQP